VSRTIERLGGRPVPREGFVTDNGNMILDAHGMVLEDPAVVEVELNATPGVVENGLFCRRRADRVLVGDDSGIREI
jgi:ribose 5-phosphate isomerase A